MGELPKARWFVVVLFGELALVSIAWCVVALVLYLASCGFRAPQNQREMTLLAGAVVMPLFGGFISFKIVTYFLAIIGCRRPPTFRFPKLEPSKRVAALFQGLMFLFFAPVILVVVQQEPKLQRLLMVFISMSAGLGIAGICIACWAISEMLTDKRNRNESDPR